MKFSFGKFLQAAVAFIEKYSPFKGELVDVEFTNSNGRISYTYKKVA
jgi:hypothetical protein